ncbi:MAG: AzlD domain-containing protein [Cyanobacteria bacterium P01_D01_bin.128]
MNEFLMVTGMAIATFAIRYVMFGASSRIHLPERLLSALRYVPPVVLTAIVVPEVLISDGTLNLGIGNARLVGAIAAILVGTTTKNLLLTIILGMAAFFGWQGLLSVFI